MNWNILIEIIIAVGAILAGFFGLVKYIVSQNTKREAIILENYNKQQTQMMEFYEKKNGHLERISNKFSESNDAMTKAINDLTTEIRVLAEKRD